MGIIPSIVIHQSRPVAHTSYLVSVIPPGHDTGIFMSVLPEPVVSLTEIVNDLSGSVMLNKRFKEKPKRALVSKLNIPVLAVRSEHNGRAGICIARHPGTMHCKHHQHHHNGDDDKGTDIDSQSL